MITFIPRELTGPVWMPIDLGQGDSIEIAVRRPTLGDQLIAWDAQCDSSSEFLLRSVIADWRGVQDANGRPVPYSFDTLAALSAVYPRAIWSILEAVSEARRPATETDLKNLPLPPDNGGTATNVETTSTTDSLDSTPTSDEPSNSQSGSA